MRKTGLLKLEEMMQIAEKATVWDSEEVLIDDNRIGFTCRGFYDGLEICATEHRDFYDDLNQTWIVSVKAKIYENMELGCFYVDTTQVYYDETMSEEDKLSLITLARRSYEKVEELCHHRDYPAVDEENRNKILAEIRDKLNK